MQNILLLGGSGFLGKNIIIKLLSYGYFRIIVIDKVNNFESDYKDKIIYYNKSLNDTDSIFNIIEKENITIIIHCISLLLPASDLNQYLTDMSQIMEPSVKIIDYCAMKRVKFIYISSGGTIYGDKQNVFNEEEFASPISHYGLSKQQMENVIDFYHRRFGLDYIILRPSNVYGYGQNIYGNQGLIAVLIGKMLNNESVIVYGDGSNIRDYIFVDDFAYYIAEILNNDIKNMIINIGSGIGHTINQIISYVESAGNKKINVEYTDSRKNDVISVVLDISKLNALLPYKQKSIEEGINAFYKKIVMNSKTYKDK